VLVKSRKQPIGMSVECRYSGARK